jgi:hypothetical protein
MKKKFTLFKDASVYAKLHAQEVGENVRLEKVGRSWVVISGPEESADSLRDKDTSPSQVPPLDEDDKWGWQEQQLNEIIKKDKKQNMVERENRERDAKERLEYLEEREKYYNLLSKDQFDELWSDRENQNLQYDEIQLLETIAREKERLVKEQELYEWRNRYRSLSEIQLLELWQGGQNPALTLDEKKLIREALREKKGYGITEDIRPRIRLCRCCGKVYESCNCMRS